MSADILNERARKDVFQGKKPSSTDEYYMSRYDFWVKVKEQQGKLKIVNQ